MSDRTCSIGGCSNPIKSVKLGWCNTHYRRWLKHGDPLYVREVNTSKPCDVEGCESLRIAFEWCDMHYRRWKKYRDPLTVKEVHFSDPEESFAYRTKRNGDCLEWTGADLPTGYGIIAIGNDNVYTHRYAWERVNGPIPVGMQIDHLCHNTWCCEVTHLRAVTHKQNMEHRKGPQSNGTSGYRGVSWDPEKNRWAVNVKHHGRVVFGGRFDDLCEAANAARDLRLKLFTHSDVDKRTIEVRDHDPGPINMGTSSAAV